MLFLNKINSGTVPDPARVDSTKAICPEYSAARPRWRSVRCRVFQGAMRFCRSELVREASVPAIDKYRLTCRPRQPVGSYRQCVGRAATNRRILLYIEGLPATKSRTLLYIRRDSAFSSLAGAFSPSGRQIHPYSRSTLELSSVANDYRERSGRLAFTIPWMRYGQRQRVLAGIERSGWIPLRKVSQ